MTLEQLNGAAPAEAVELFARCCGSARWARAMAEGRPYESAEALLAAAERQWGRCGPEDWREAFAAHPRIGGKDALREKFAGTRAWAQGEQSSVARASEDTLDALAKGNERYERRFGHIFIVCATGKSAEEMLALLEARLSNEPDAESRVAAAEQAKITRLRLQKLLS